MKSFIAALRTLVLPFGATSGRRIILDGVEGEIRVYDDTDVMRLLIGGLDNESIELSTGDSDETTRGRFFANVQNQGNPEEAPILWLISPALNGQTESFIALTGEAADSSEPADIRLFTDEAFVFADLLSLAAGIRFLVAATGADDVEIEEGVISINTDVNLYRGAANTLQTDDTFNAVTDLQAASRSVGRGVLELASATANVGPTSGTTELTLLSVTVTLEANRRYRLHAHLRSASHTVDTDGFALRFKEGGTTLNEMAYGATGQAGGAEPAAEKRGKEFIHYIDGTTAGSHTYDLVFVRLTGTGTATAEAAATFPMQLVIEDVGPNTNI